MELAKTLILKSIGILWFLRRSRAAILSFVMRLVIHLTEGLSCLFNICITSLLGILNRFIASVSIELKLFETLQLNDFLYHTQTLKDINFDYDCILSCGPHSDCQPIQATCANVHAWLSDARSQGIYHWEHLWGQNDADYAGPTTYDCLDHKV